MKSRRYIFKKWYLASFTLILTHLLASIGSACASEVLQPIRVLAGSSDVRWELGSGNYHLRLPWLLDIASRPGSEKPAIGLVHSGYSVIDPDGRSAVLSLTLRFRRDSSADTNQDRVAKIISFTPEFIDLGLDADASELKRLRSQLAMPRKIAAVASQFPIQIKWDNPSGQTLYEWLTKKEGLRIEILGKAEMEYSAQTLYELDYPCLEKSPLGSAIFSTNKIKYIGDSATIALSIVASGCIRASSPGSQSVLLSFLPNSLFSRIAEHIGRKAVDEDGVHVITADDFKAAFTGMSHPFVIRIITPVSLTVYPGAVLARNPENVKDLSGGVSGLEGLLGSNVSKKPKNNKSLN